MKTASPPATQTQKQTVLKWNTQVSSAWLTKLTEHCMLAACGPFTWRLFTETLLYVVIETISIMYSYRTLSSVLPGNTFQNVSSKTTHVPQHSLYSQLPKKILKYAVSDQLDAGLCLGFLILASLRMLRGLSASTLADTHAQKHTLPSLTYK